MSEWLTMFSTSELPALLTPLPIYGMLLVAVVAWRSRRRIWWLVLAWLYLMSVPATADRAASWLENRYRPIDNLAVYDGYPVVLLTSGRVRLDPVQGWVNRPAESGWERLLVAVETRRRTGGRLIIAGGIITGQTSGQANGQTGERTGAETEDVAGEPIARTMQRMIERIGIDAGEILLETKSLNTYENLAFLEEQLEKQPFILVTSAAHMPRAMAVAERLGLLAIPQPADYLASEVVGLRSFVPAVSAIAHWQAILHEVIGLLYYRLQGQAT